MEGEGWGILKAGSLALPSDSSWVNSLPWLVLVCWSPISLIEDLCSTDDNPLLIHILNYDLIVFMHLALPLPLTDVYGGVGRQPPCKHLPGSPLTRVSGIPRSPWNTLNCSPPFRALHLWGGSSLPCLLHFSPFSPRGQLTFPAQLRTPCCLVFFEMPNGSKCLGLKAKYWNQTKAHQFLNHLSLVQCGAWHALFKEERLNYLK